MAPAMPSLLSVPLRVSIGTLLRKQSIYQLNKSSIAQIAMGIRVAVAGFPIGYLTMFGTMV